MTREGGVDVIVRALRGDDRAAWEPLWQGYLAFYETPLDDELTDLVFQRLTDDGYAPLAGLVAEVDGVLRGFAHTQTHPSTWSAQLDCYLEDLFVTPDARGAGVGRALIEAIADEGRDLGWRKIHWLTDTDNATAQRLYDEVAVQADQRRYTLDLG
ncbi:MAG: GNAT superfamily N-acetyltransferase [Nitriliruptoraceae bacterium]